MTKSEKYDTKIIAAVSNTLLERLLDSFSHMKMIHCQILCSCAGNAETVTVTTNGGGTPVKPVATDSRLPHALSTTSYPSFNHIWIWFFSSFSRSPVIQPTPILINNNGYSSYFIQRPHIKRKILSIKQHANLLHKLIIVNCFIVGRSRIMYQFHCFLFFLYLSDYPKYPSIQPSAIRFTKQ